MTDVDLAVKFFLQLLVILATCRVMGWLGKRFLGQSQVVMEMLAGILLGPSLLGLLAPQVKQYLFPNTLTLASGETIRHPSMQILYVVCQLGLVLYMFMVGNEFDTGLIKNRVASVASVSIAGIVVPFILGATIALTLSGAAPLFNPSIEHSEAALFMGAAMCVTAFPVLARIIYDAGITRTSMGTLALGAGAMDDAFAWCLLAVVLAMTKSDVNIAVLSITGCFGFVLVMATVGTRLFSLLAKWTEKEGDLTPPILITTLGALMICAWFTDSIGVHAVFGAFIAGAMMPKGQFAEMLKARIEPLTVNLLIPLFFVFSGLNTQVGLLNSALLWGIAAIIILAAILGKMLGCGLAARLTGEPWREAWTIGSLMNARGLMELIMLNIGLQQGLITPTLFTIMVLMAIVTTLMATPLYRLLYGKYLPIKVGAKNEALASV